MVAAAIRSNSRVTIPELAKVIKVTERQARRIIANLKKKAAGMPAFRFLARLAFVVAVWYYHGHEKLQNQSERGRTPLNMKTGEKTK